jgi:hypothetical protein
MASLATFKVPEITNEPNVRYRRSPGAVTGNMLTRKQQHYAAGSEQRARLQAALAAFRKTCPVDVPLVIGGQHVRVPSA